MNLWYNRVTTHHIPKGDPYELPPSYHRRALLSTGILQKRIQLSKNSGIIGAKREYDIAGIKAELFVYECKAGVISTHSAEEMQFKTKLLS